MSQIDELIERLQHLRGVTRMNELEKMLLAQSLTNEDGSVHNPQCCGQIMADAGGCSEGCCDDYKCSVCGKTLRVEWPD